MKSLFRGNFPKSSIVFKNGDISSGLLPYALSIGP
jgi:hypothetical protein